MACSRAAHLVLDPSCFAAFGVNNGSRIVHISGNSGKTAYFGSSRKTWYSLEFRLLGRHARPFFISKFRQSDGSRMYAIIADGGRQYKVEEGQMLEIDFREVTAGDTLTFDRVLAVSSESGFKLGKPTVSGAKVSAKVIGETKGDKIFIQKFRRRKNSKRRTGHRQKYVKVQISSIAG